MTNASPVHIRGRGYRIYSPRAQLRYPETTNPYGAAKFKALKLNETLTPGLLTAGKQLSSEAVEALCGGNVFSTTSSNLPMFLSTIGDMACESLHRLQIEVEIAKDWKLSGLSCLSKLPRLRELLLSFARVGGKYVQLFAAKLFFEQTREWITTIGERRHDRFAAANTIKATSRRTCPPSQGFMPPYDRESREMVIRDAGCSNFDGDLRKFIDEPGLAESDELSTCFATHRLPQQYSGPEWSRWRIIEDVRARGVFLDDLVDDLGSDTVNIGPVY
ncbi:uncharacterized protein J3D65DRAFT_613804 [Phyllosticta citribraziliensis]|uniref:Uncharacterized protein n=1 Tax=Phyllosticta citribraziliensis TaxID=989973 RepID=A0ABR1M4C9_9PEZI